MDRQRPRPDFFVIGAPKCGTTALYEYLKANRRIGLSHPKELDYFCTDYGEKFREIGSFDEYLSCFAHVRPRCAAVGEFSVSYLLSQEAVPNILKFSPDAKFIAIVRNPIEMVHAWHAQVLYSRDEAEPDVERAWDLQARRARGLDIPKSTREPIFLQYRKMASFGEQIRRLYARVPADRVKVIVFDDFAAETGRVYAEVLEFIGAPHDGRTEFPRVNENRAHRYGVLGDFVERPPEFFSRALSRIKELTGIRRLGITEVIRRLNTQTVAREPLQRDFREVLAAEFRDDVAELSSLLQRDLSYWLADAGESGDLSARAARDDDFPQGSDAPLAAGLAGGVVESS